MVLSFLVDKQTITRVDKEKVVRDSMNYLYANFEFSPDWTGQKTAVFKSKSGAFNVLLDDDGKCLVPWEVLQDEVIEISVFCGALITANVVKIITLASGYTIGESGRVPTPGVYEQIIAKLNEIEAEVDPEALQQIIEAYLAEHDYVTGDDLETAIANFITASDAETIVAAYVEAHKSEWQGSEVEVTQTLQSGTKIAEISVDGTTTNLYAPAGGGGATALDDLTDVDLTTPQSGDVLVYDGQKWGNEDIGDMYVTPSAVHNGVYTETYGHSYGTATVKSDGSVDFVASGENYTGPFFTVPVNPNMTNEITIHCTVVDLSFNGTLFARNSNGVLSQLRYATFSTSIDTIHMTLTPEDIAGLQTPLYIGITSNQAISYNVSISNEYGDGITISDVKKRAYYPLSSKTVMFLGDSITAYNGVQSWTDKFLELTDTVQLEKVAVNGAVLWDYEDTVYDGDPKPTEQHNNTLGNQVQKIINNQYDSPDLIVIAIGTNGGISATDEQIKATYVDSSLNKVPLADLDKTTSAGAFRYCNETLHNLYPDAKIVWCSPIQGATKYPYTVSAWDDTLSKLTQSGAVHHVHTNRCGIFFANEIHNQNGEYLQDGLHPNEAGAWQIAKYNAAEITKLFV